MIRYLARRTLQAVPVLLAVAFITYFLVFATGDPARLMLGVRADEATARALQEEWGIAGIAAARERLVADWLREGEAARLGFFRHKAVVTADLGRYGAEVFRAYARFLGQLVLGPEERPEGAPWYWGRLGRSVTDRRDVATVILEKIPPSFKVALAALCISIVAGLGIGTLSSTKPYSALDHLVTVGSVFAISIPSFFLGIVLAWLFGYVLGVLPVAGYLPGVAGVRYLVLPALALAVYPTALIARLVRTSMLSVMQQDFIRTARAKGLSEMRVVLLHGMRNSLIPVVTVLSGSLAGLVSGAFFIEVVFEIPGMGRYAVDAVTQHDFPVVVATVLVSATAFVVGNILVDVAYAALDPRIKHR